MAPRSRNRPSGKHSGMAKQRAMAFPPKLRSKFIEWDARVVQGNVYITIKPPDGAATQMRLDPDDAYDFASDVNRAVDQAVGI